MLQGSNDVVFLPLSCETPRVFTAHPLQTGGNGWFLLGLVNEHCFCPKATPSHQREALNSTSSGAAVSPSAPSSVSGDLRELPGPSFLVVCGMLEAILVRLCWGRRRTEISRCRGHGDEPHG